MGFFGRGGGGLRDIILQRVLQSIFQSICKSENVPSPAKVDWFTYRRISGLGSFRAFSYDSFNISIHPYNQVHDKKNLHRQEKEKKALSVCHEFQRIVHAVVTRYGNGKWTKASIMNYWLQIQRPENILWQTWIIQPVKISSLIVVVQ